MSPVRVAAADIGSNAIRFLAVEEDGAGSWRVLDQLRVPLRLGRDVFLTGRLSQETFSEAVRALSGFTELLRAHQIERYRAVATSAMREAANGPALVEALQATGLNVEVIDGSEEARLVYLAVRERLELTNEPWILADLGGGSLEVSLIDKHGIHDISSLPIGAVRLLEATAEQSDVAAFERLIHAHERKLRATPAMKSNARTLVATGGNIEALNRIAGIRPDRRGVSELPVVLLSEVAHRVANTAVPDRIKQWQLQHDRADVILPAAIVYLRLARLAKTDQIIVPAVGVKEGIVFELLGR